MGHIQHMGHAMMMGEGHKAKKFHRHFYTKEEKKEWLSNYVEELKKELQAAEEKLKQM